MQKLLHVLIVVILFGFFPLLAYSQYAEDDGYYNDYYQSQNQKYYYRDTNNDYYSSSNYADNSADNFPAYDDGYQAYHPHHYSKHRSQSSRYSQNSSPRLPRTISPPGEPVVIVDPRVHRWGAYDASGNLIREGMASAGSGWCRDLGRSCHTSVGTFRVHSLGGSGCVSSKFPLGRGGAPMPYCMYFNRNQALHGSYEVADANISHGCVRLHVDDAEWLRFNFVRMGTKVIIKPYY